MVKYSFEYKHMIIPEYIKRRAIRVSKTKKQRTNTIEKLFPTSDDSLLLVFFPFLLTHFFSVALLFEKWFACFPTSGDSLRFVYFSF